MGKNQVAVAVVVVGCHRCYGVIVTQVMFVILFGSMHVRMSQAFYSQ